MDHRPLGRSGLLVSALSLGTSTFGKDGEVLGNLSRLVEVALEAGVTLFDTADVYARGASEEALGKAIRGRRDRLLLASKASFATGPGPNDVGSSRHHLLRAVEGSLRRLGTDHLDLYQLHAFDAVTPLEETLGALDDLVRSGKVRYVGCSNFSGWQLMKSLAVAERCHLPRHVSHQVYYSLVGRDYEHELMPLGLDQRVGALVWSPLGWGRLTGKLRRGQPLPPDSRLQDPAIAALGPQVPEERLFAVLDALEALAAETGRTVPQLALNWLLRRPTVASVIVGARTEAQLRENLGAVGWSLTPDQVARLDRASQGPLPYPAWHQRPYVRNPPPVERS